LTALKYLLFVLGLFSIGCDIGKDKYFKEKTDDSVIEYWLDIRKQKTGPCLIYNLDGTLRDLMTYQSDLIDGMLLSYYPNGRLKAIINVSNGKKHGFKFIFFPDGKLNEISVYYDNIQKYIRESGPDGKSTRQEGHLPDSLLGETTVRFLSNQYSLRRGVKETLLIFKTGACYDAIKVSVDDGSVTPTPNKGVYWITTSTKNSLVNIRVDINSYNGVTMAENYQIPVK
jgi:hypothetical protein